MLEVPLTNGGVALIDDSDVAIVRAHKWYAVLGGRVTYAQAHVRKADGTKTTIQMHKLIMGVSDRNRKIDHVDLDGLNNQRRNLRWATDSEQGQNQRLHANNTSGFKGVSLILGRRWKAQIQVKGTNRHIGYFATAREAALAYDSECRRIFGSFARTNFGGHEALQGSRAS